VSAIHKDFRGQLSTDARIAQVEEYEDHVKMTFEDHQVKKFDYVIFAVHADQVLSLLPRATKQQKLAFEDWRYNTNDTSLHTDASIMPKNKKAWASWNFHERKTSADLTVTYHMNRLQSLNSAQEFCVSLNSDDQLQASRLIKSYRYMHPMYQAGSLEHQDRIKKLNAQGRLRFCGAYLGFGFHEDAVKSAVDVCKDFGAEL